MDPVAWPGPQGEGKVPNCWDDADPVVVFVLPVVVAVEDRPRLLLQPMTSVAAMTTMTTSLPCLFLNRTPPAGGATSVGADRRNHITSVSHKSLQAGWISQDGSFAANQASQLTGSWPPAWAEICSRNHFR